MKVGFIGLGTMGTAMAQNVLRGGFDLIVHNRTREKEKPLAEADAARAASPAEAARNADIVVICVSDTPDVEAVLFGAGGVAEGAKPDTLVCDMSTIAPDATREFGKRLAERGVRMIDAPVSGGSEGAEKGTLTIMCGGDAADVERARSVLEAMGSKITHVGPLGAGQLTKAVNQIIIAGNFLGLAEGITFAIKAGLDANKVLEAISSGMARSAVLEMRASNMVNNSYPLGFKLALHLKDLRIALDEAERNGVDLPLARMVREMEEQLVTEHGNEDMSALAIAIRNRAGL